MEEYLPRAIEGVIEEDLEMYGAVAIEGRKWCGKSTTAARFAKSKLELQNQDFKQNNLFLAENKPSKLLKGEKPRMIDEWQDMPELWDAVRYEVDKSGLAGQYILTGSATPKKKKPTHSGAGRIVRERMRTMSLFESKNSTGEVSLGKLFQGELEVDGIGEIGLDELASLCERGGWPVAVTRELKNPAKVARDYLTSVLESGGYSEDAYVYDPEKMRAVIRSIARNVATPANMATVYNDVNNDESKSSISDVTVANYVGILEQIFLLDNVVAWSPDLRSKTQVRRAKKWSFVDPSIAMAALQASADDLMNDIRTYGLIFESLALRDLKVYAQALDGRVFYFRDKNGVEADAVIHLGNGKWGAVEIKLGADEETLDAAAKELLKFKSLIDTERMREPSFLMILSGISRYAFRRNDGVLVVPVGCLRD